MNPLIEGIVPDNNGRPDWEFYYDQDTITMLSTGERARLWFGWLFARQTMPPDTLGIDAADAAAFLDQNGRDRLAKTLGR